MAGRVEQVSSMRWIDVKEYAYKTSRRHGDLSILSSRTWNHNRLFLEELFKECQTVIEWLGQVNKVKPDVERAGGRVVDFEAKPFETLEHIVSLSFEVTLKGELRKDRYALIIQTRGPLPFLSSRAQGQGEVSLPLAI
jgi:hypothetical protein